MTRISPPQSPSYYLELSILIILLDLPNLQKLSLARISKVTSSGVAQLWTGTDSQLENIDLSRTQIEENPAAINVFRILATHAKLTSLAIDGCKVSFE